MDNYTYNSYPESGESSPRSREVDFENPPPWEDQQNGSNHKVRFMCSYGGKIHPRPHDNQLSYIGGETKIFAVDRNIKFSAMINKLSALCGDTDVSFKYQLPGEDLDALISVTSDDDLDHMMHEYDRLFRALAKPARMRLFLFPVHHSHSSFGSDGSKSDRERFVEALNSAPTQPPEKTAPPHNVADYLFGLEKGVPVPPGVKIHEPVPEPVVPHPEIPVLDDRVMRPDRVIGSDPTGDMQRQLLELQRLQLREQEQAQAMYRRKSEDNNIANEYYIHKMPERVPAPNSPVTAPPPVTASPGYWSEKHTGGYSAPVTTPSQPEQPVYMISAPGPVYTSPVMRPATTQTSPGYYAMQRVNPEVSREQQMYNVVQPHMQQQQPQPAPLQPNIQPQQLMGVMRPTGGGGGVGMGVTDTGGYAPVAVYDNNGGRQVYYTPPPGVVTHPPPYQGVAAVDVRHPVGLGQDGKVVTKISQTSV